MLKMPDIQYAVVTTNKHLAILDTVFTNRDLDIAQSKAAKLFIQGYMSRDYMLINAETQDSILAYFTDETLAYRLSLARPEGEDD